MDQETSRAMNDRENYLVYNSDITYGNDNSRGQRVDNCYHPHRLEATVMPYPSTTYNFIPPVRRLPNHGLPSESIARMAPPPQPHSTTYPQPPMLVMSSDAIWPSMITPHSYGSHPAPPLTIYPPVETLTSPALPTQPVPRKTLTDVERKAICQYAEDHPRTKQTEIGAQFGVERR
jgi:hypothetical protein